MSYRPFIKALLEEIEMRMRDEHDRRVIREYIELVRDAAFNDVKRELLRP